MGPSLKGMNPNYIWTLLFLKFQLRQDQAYVVNIGILLTTYDTNRPSNLPQKETRNINMSQNSNNKPYGRRLSEDYFAEGLHYILAMPNQFVLNNKICVN